MEKVPKKKYVEIQTIPFQNDYPINAQLENTGKILVALQPKYPWHYVVYPILEVNSSTPFSLLIRLNKKSDDERMLWIMGNEVYDVVTIKMKCNWKYNWTVSFMETKNYRS